jgi:succinate-semialdehyde dehydrogenase/glutarate-semialdehyde dehydrogenase
MPIASINPATDEKLKEFFPFDDAEIEKRLKRAERTRPGHIVELPLASARNLWRPRPSCYCWKKDRLAEIITLEMGKLFRASVDEVLRCARGCRFYAENAERFLEDEPAQTDAARSYVRYEPMGPVLAIMPWNFRSGRCFDLPRQP